MKEPEGGGRMSLNFDFTKCGDLDEDQKKLAHEVIPWLLFGAHIGSITEYTIPHIVAREKIKPILNEPVVTEEWLRPFIGFGNSY